MSTASLASSLEKTLEQSASSFLKPSCSTHAANILKASGNLVLHSSFATALSSLAATFPLCQVHIGPLNPRSANLEMDQLLVLKNDLDLKFGAIP
ncbi:uncharacterized protein G2W53_004559 [Senna tora]|uniref:Uncharacterized protein n=1 Tax=Senna tora TaxID=362788 RepID=A0A835CGK5_9FABA|nr:uncharacterized protein G2W53_004559 [Senna tora]